MSEQPSPERMWDEIVYLREQVDALRAPVRASRRGHPMTLATRLRRALCRHDWLTMLSGHPVGVGDREKCRKCGVLRRVEP